MINEIKEKYKNLPHIKKVWVKNSEVYLVNISGSELLDLSKQPVADLPEQNPVEPVTEKPKKNKTK